MMVAMVMPEGRGQGCGRQGESLPLSLQSRLRFAYNAALQNDLYTPHTHTHTEIHTDRHTHLCPPPGAGRQKAHVVFHFQWGFGHRLPKTLHKDLLVPLCHLFLRQNPSPSPTPHRCRSSEWTWQSTRRCGDAGPWRAVRARGRGGVRGAAGIARKHCSQRGGLPPRPGHLWRLEGAQTRSLARTAPHRPHPHPYPHTFWHGRWERPI